MTRLVLITLLLLSSGPAYAEWVVVEKRNDGTTVYVDPATIRRKGNLVKMWDLTDFRTIEVVAGISLLSRKGQSEYDCAEARHRTLALTEFSGNMGNGEVVFSDATEQKWQPVEPESIGRMLWTLACGKK
jgi:surface-adhesin protein E